MTDIAQTVIAILTCLGMALVTSHYAPRRWFGCVVNLIAQPAWLWSTWVAGQWGMFIVAVVLTVIWARGVVIHRARGKKEN